jgi:menaquinone reductase, multiheme cytochrome c subunit
MSAMFSKQHDLIVKAVLGAVALGLVGGAALYTYGSHPKIMDTGYQPVQPVPYSHKLHAGNLGMDCFYCHFTAEKSGHASVPTTETCMNCHVRVKPASPLLARVRESYATGQPVPWVKVHRLPDYGYFNHQAHVTVGVSCVSCHGRVDQMVEVRQVEPLSMAWCLDCHRNPAPHVRPRELVTNLAWQPDRNPADIGREIIAANQISPPEHCSGCHR